MNDTDDIGLPPLPAEGARGPEVCAVMRLYLSLWSDLSREQMQKVTAHVETCADCTQEQRIINRATYLVAALDSSTPSARVDQAVMAAIAARAHQKQAPSPLRPVPSMSTMMTRPNRSARRKSPLRLAGMLAAAAVLIAMLVSAHFLFPSLGLPGTPGSPTGPGITQQQAAFALPADLSWSTYVLHFTQTLRGSSGQLYHVESYTNLSNGMANVETTMDGELDVDAVGDEHQVLGMDMMHHVAQWGANDWMADDSMFDLTTLRKELQTKQAVYLGKDTFHGQEVYRIRYANGLVLLLDMQYHPVNVLQGAVGPGTGEPMYDNVQLLPQSKVSNSMWDMSIPSGFKMGRLPARP